MLQLDYSYGTTTNNGNVQSQTITVPTIGSAVGFADTQTYSYDSLNRLSSAQENGGSSWTQNFSYDRYGNRNFALGTTLPEQLTPSNNPVINTGNNRLDITVSGQTNVTYDPAGNLTHDINGHAYVYDGENKQTTYDGGASANGGATYYYDGDGRRVKKIVGGSPMTSTVFVYDIQGHLVAEYGNAQPTTTGGTSYLTEDTLGTPRVNTDASGNVRARHDYLPFGEELGAGTGGRTPQQGYVGDNVRQKFTDKERDGETGLDYFLARYYSSTQGRFTSPDPLLSSGKTIQPQSWNRYSYCVNTPLNAVDPTGLDWWYETDAKNAQPVWKGRDPGKGWKRWTDTYSFVYQDTAKTGLWVALDPNGNRAFVTNSEDRANTQFDAYVGGQTGLIAGSQAEREFTAGLGSGLTPLGVFADMMNEANGLDTTSRDYITGRVLGIGISGGLGMASGITQVANAGEASQVARISPGSLSAEEEAQVLNTMGHVDAGTQPVGPLATRWGIPFRNDAGDLPGVAGAGGYSEFRVAPPPGVAGAGVRRIVVNDLDGAMYYSWTHYGTAGQPAFVRIR